jgi:hypothetical protein
MSKRWLNINGLYWVPPKHKIRFMVGYKQIKKYNSVKIVATIFYTKVDQQGFKHPQTVIINIRSV